MAFLVTDSAFPLPFDTLPALKLTEFCGRPRRGPVYAYLRCYVQAGSLHFSATVFDGAPPATSRMGLAITADPGAGRYLFAQVGRGTDCRLTLYENDAPLRQLACPPVRHLAGQDEQGEYWSAESRLEAGVFRACFGRAPAPGMVLPGNVYLFDPTEAAYGAAFPGPAGGPVPAAEGFGAFVVVPY